MIASPVLPRKCTKKYVPSGGQHIKVFVRVRPMNKIEKDLKSYSLVECSNTKEVVVQERAHDKITKKFTFDKVFSPESKQVDIYKAVAKPLVDEVLNGFNCTIFAYGQTGTGKTYTMEGDGLSSLDDNPAAGIIPRCVNHLFDELRCQKLEFTMRVSFLELYNEELFDLLSAHDDLSKLRIYEDCTRKGSCIIQGLEEVLVRCKADVYSIIEKGSAKRQTAATMMNAQSSRSHTVFTVTVHIKENTNEGDELLKTGKLHLVDLAGSENIGRSGAVDKRAREAGNINQSLLTLGRVITCLVEKAPHIPYRESKLTRLLQDALGGRTKTSIIATVSPAQINLEETLSTLDYAHRAKNIQNKPEVNQKLNKKELIGEYTNEIERLRRDLLAMREKNGVYLANENYQEMIATQEQQEHEISEKIAQIRALEEEAEKQMEYFNEIAKKLEETSEKLVSTVSSLESTKITLQCTQKLLIQTAAEKEEQKFLVKAHCKTEDYLHNQGKNLINTALLTSSDISKLHEKLDRKRKVEYLNSEIEGTFSENFKDKIDSILLSMSNMQEQNQKDIDSINNKLKSCLATTEKELESVSTKGKIILSTNLLALNDLQVTIQGMLEKFCQFKTHEALLQMCVTETDHLNLFREETFSPRVKKMNETLCQQSELLSSLKKFVDEQVDKIEEQCLTVCKEQSDLISNIEKEVENMHSLEETEAKVYSDKRREEEVLIEEDINHEIDILNEIEGQMELMQNQMTSHRQLITLQRKTQMEEEELKMATQAKEMKLHMQKVEENMENIILEMKAHRQVVETKMECQIQAMRIHRQEVEQKAEIQMQEMQTQMQTQLQQIKTNMQRIYCHQSTRKERMLQNLQKISTDKEEKRVAMENATKKILKDSHSSVSLSSSHSKCCTDSSENIQTKVNDQIKQLDSNIKELGNDRIILSSMVEDKVSSISRTLLDINNKTSESKSLILELATTSKGKSKSMFDIAVSKLSSEMDEQISHLSDVQTSITESINKLCLCLSETELNIRENLSRNHTEVAVCGQTVEELLTQQLVKDVPTGLTPVRKEYIFPKVLSRTSPHERLLERHRANVSTASRIPLPSFSQDNDDNDDSLEANPDIKASSSNSSMSENESIGSNLADNINQILYKSESLKEFVFREPCPVISRHGSKENLLVSGPPSRSSSTSSLDSKENFEGISTRRTGSFKKRELRQPSITTFNNVEKGFNSDIKSRKILGNHN